MSGARGITLLCVFLAAGACWQASAQTYNAVVVGRIVDPQGAGVPAATVRIVEQDRGTVFSTLSNEAGEYTIPGVTPGTYRVEVTKPDFETAIVRDVVLRPLVEKRVNVNLLLGSVTQSVQVSEAAPTIETQSPTLTSVEPKQVLDHPISNDSRAWILQSLEWFPDSVPAGGWMLFGAGQRSQQNFTIEGMSLNPFYASLPENAVSELQFTSENAGAEFARPVNVNVTFRSGTNQFHGGTQWSLVNPCLNGVNTPFYQYDEAAHNGRRPSPCTSIWYELWNVGGPVRIPRFYDGRNKAFFYFTYHRNLDKTGFVNTNVFYSAPSPEMQSGNFSHYNKTITDPATGQTFPGNMIPAVRINAVTKAWNNLAWGPGPGLTYLSPTSFQNNVQTLGYYGGPWWDYTLKFDQNIGQKDTAAFLYRMFGDDGWQNSPWSNNSPRTFNISGIRVHDFNISEVHTFNARTVNELRVGVDRQWSGATPSSTNRTERSRRSQASPETNGCNSWEFKASPLDPIPPARRCST